MTLFQILIASWFFIFLGVLALAWLLHEFRIHCGEDE